MSFSCSKSDNEKQTAGKNLIDTLVVSHSMKGWELYSWPVNNTWEFSILAGTNRIKSLEEVTSDKPSGDRLIRVSGIDSLELVLDKFPENEYITWIGANWLRQCWKGDYGNLQLPPHDYIDDITQYCIQKKLVLLVTE
jgi:hypothetical protein